MSKHTIYWSLIYAFGLGSIGACSSKNKEPEWVPPKQVEQSKTEWDYGKIRETREAERIDTANNGAVSQDKVLEDCVVVSRTEMIRSKRQGCKPSDPRLGQGPDSFCCPR